LGYVDPSETAFIPLYPGLVGSVSALLGHAHGPVWPDFHGVRLLVALAIAYVFTLAGFVGLALLAVVRLRLHRSGMREPMRGAP
jgi:hypothetical protein